MFESFTQETYKRIVLIFYLIISLSFMMVKSQRMNNTIKSAISSIISPGEKILNDVYNTTSSFWKSLDEIKRLKREVAILQQKLEDVKQLTLEIEELKKENKQLREILNLKKQLHFPTVYAEIIGRDPSNFFSLFLIDKGRKHGIRVNMPVIAYQRGEKAVVGKIIEVSTHYSKVLPITGAGSYIAGMLAEKRGVGIIKGMGPLDENLYMDYLSKDINLNIGDKVITSGQGGIFPKGLTIGNIVSYQKPQTGKFYLKVKVKPWIDFSTLESVLIIRCNPVDEAAKFIEGD